MRLLLFSDFHDSINAKALKAALFHQQDPDLVLTLGDISVVDLITIKELTTPAPIYGIAGNHDGHNALYMAGIEDLHGKCIELSGICFAGFGGSVKYKHGPHVMYSQKESLEIAKNLPKADILVSHDIAFQGLLPPNLLSEFSTHPHEGFVGIKEYLKKSNPFLHVHGHIHKNQRYLFKGTDTISVYGAATVTLSDKRVIEYRPLFLMQSD